MTTPIDRYQKITAFSIDLAIDEMELKYDPYLDIQQIDSIFNTFKIECIDPDAEVLTYRFSWNTEYDLPLELKRDVLALYEKHFNS